MDITRQFEQTLASRLEEIPRHMQVVLGPRQVGKTTGVKRLIRNLAKTQEREFHFETAGRPAAPSIVWIEEQWRKARMLPSGSILVIDEIQKIPRWSEMVKRPYEEDRPKAALHVILLGCASLTLEQGLTELSSPRIIVQ